LANDPAVLCWIGQAEAIWLAGGDQSHYLVLWPQTVHSGLAALNSRGGAIGGTSAGAVSLGEAAFNARNGTVTSPEALADPLNPDVSLSYPAFAAPELQGTMVDSHFMDRGREGRLLAFLARFLTEQSRSEVVGVGLDEGVALVIEGGSATVYAPAGQSAWLYRVTGPVALEEGEPLGLSGIRRVRLDDGTELSWPPDFGSLPFVQMEVVDGVVGVIQ
jgi:cyanophycinase-like exopeptidase